MMTTSNNNIRYFIHKEALSRPVYYCIYKGKYLYRYYSKDCSGWIFIIKPLWGRFNVDSVLGNCKRISTWRMKWAGLRLLSENEIINDIKNKKIQYFQNEDDHFVYYAAYTENNADDLYIFRKTLYLNENGHSAYSIKGAKNGIVNPLIYQEGDKDWELIPKSSSSYSYIREAIDRKSCVISEKGLRAEGIPLIDKTKAV